MNTQVDERQACVSAKDISGFAVFSNGGEGTAHVIAHRMLDAGRFELGHRRLGEWLDGRCGSGSQWLHLQFHMGIFELAVGDWEAAYTRFRREILPAASTTEEALTDAPGLLWRVAASAPYSVDLPWQPLRRTALRCLANSPDSFVTMHHLLALAGARDDDSIEHWLRTCRVNRASKSERIVRRMAEALHAVAAGAYGKAARRLRRLIPQLSQIGGSHAQNGLFLEMHDWCCERSNELRFNATELMAAA
jgi:hypothetical protein